MSDGILTSLVCPITQQIFRDPVVASDGNTYERMGLVLWLMKNNTSPKTREPLNKYMYSNKLIAELIDQMESIDPKISDERFKFDLIGFIVFLVEKFDIDVDSPYYQMMDELMGDGSFEFDDNKMKLMATEWKWEPYNIHSTCKGYKCDKYCGYSCCIPTVLASIIGKIDFVRYIDTCRMPDRKILYHMILNDARYNTDDNMELTKKTKNIIKNTLDDEGLSYFIQTFSESMYHRLDAIKMLFDNIPVTHFKSVRYNGFKELIRSFKTLEEFINLQINLFDPEFSKWMLHCFLSSDLSYQSVGLENPGCSETSGSIKIITDLLENPLILSKITDSDPSGKNIFHCVFSSLNRCTGTGTSNNKNHEHLIELLLEATPQTLKSIQGINGLHGLIDSMHCKESEQSKIYSYYLNYFFKLNDWAKIPEKHINDIVVKFFRYRGKSYDEIKEFIDLMITHHIDIHKKYTDTDPFLINNKNFTNCFKTNNYYKSEDSEMTIFSLYLRSTFQSTNPIINISSNRSGNSGIFENIIETINLFLGLGICITEIDIQIIASLIVQQISSKNCPELNELLSYLEKSVKSEDLDSVRCSLLLYPGKISAQDTMNISQKTSDPNKKYTFNGIKYTIESLLNKKI